jgi:hypothetical protein
LGAALALLCVAGLVGCTSAFDTHRQDLRAEHDAGNYQRAAAVLDEPEVQDEYGERNRTLWLLDRGAVALKLGDSDAALRSLEEAEKRIDAHRELRPDESAAQWVLNDTVVPYVAAPYEDAYVNVLKMLARLERGEVDGGATVEARRLANKANLLRDKYLQEAKALEKQAGDRYAAAERSGAAKKFATPTGGEFIGSPLGDYLTAITFMKTGDREFQRVAGRRLVQSIEAVPQVFPNVKKDAFAGLAEMNPDAGNVLVVGLAGRGPYLVPERVGPIAVYSVPVYFELPKMQFRDSAVRGARVEVREAGGAAREVGRLELVEDLAAVAEENFARQRPLIYQRTLVRYLVKAAATVGASEAVAQSQDGNDGTRDLVRIVGGLIGLAVLGATERADLRSWEFLPGRAFVGLVKLEPGEHEVRVVYLSKGDGSIDVGGWRKVVVPTGDVASQLATVVETTVR